MTAIQLARKTKGLTVREVADRAQVSPAFVSKLERGLIGVRAETAKRIAAVLDMDPAEVVFPERVAS